MIRVNRFLYLSWLLFHTVLCVFVSVLEIVGKKLELKTRVSMKKKIVLKGLENSYANLLVVGKVIPDILERKELYKVKMPIFLWLEKWLLGCH